MELETKSRDILSEVRSLQRDLMNFETQKKNQISHTTYLAQLRMQTKVLCGVVALITLELFSGGFITQNLMEKNSDPIFRFIGVTAILTFLAVNFYWGRQEIKAAALQISENVETFKNRNFAYHKNKSHTLDMLIKFLIVSGLIIGQKPEWVASILFIFTGDYLFQARYFSLHDKTAKILGALSCAFALVQWMNHSPTVLFPLLWFGFVNIFSLYYVSQLKRIDD